MHTCTQIYIQVLRDARKKNYIWVFYTPSVFLPRITLLITVDSVDMMIRQFEIDNQIR